MRCYKSDREIEANKLLLCHKRRHLFAFNLFDDISICLLFRFILHCHPFVRSFVRRPAAAASVARFDQYKLAAAN